MFCKYCGKQLDNDAIYCTNCGKNQKNVESSTYTQSHHADDRNSHYGGSNRPSISVSFFDAIKNFYVNYANFSGRAVRSEYWWAYLYNCIAGMLLSCLPEELSWLSFVWSVVHFIPGISLCVRRFHDVDKSGGFYFRCLLFSTLPIVFAVFALFNQLSFLAFFLSILSLVSTIILICNLCKGSSFSDNQWGLSPYNTGHEYDESQTWRCPKCGCRTANSYLTCKNCGETKPQRPRSPQPPPPSQKSKKCVCGEIVFSDRCPNCGREM